VFSKYEIYTTTESMYCYSDSNVLKNKFGIRTLEELKKAEEEITSVKQYELLLNPISGRFSKTHLMRVHRFLFEDIYAFAGKIRKEQIGKANTWFYPPNLILRELDKLFEILKVNKAIRGFPEEEFFDRTAYIMAELNAIHPFREGNGRAIREFIRELALNNGHKLNWGNVNNDVLLEKSIRSIDDYKELIPVLLQCVDERVDV